MTNDNLQRRRGGQKVHCRNARLYTLGNQLLKTVVKFKKKKKKLNFPYTERHLATNYSYNPIWALSLGYRTRSHKLELAGQGANNAYRANTKDTEACTMAPSSPSYR